MICNNKYWRVILQPQDIALLSEGGKGSDPETEISSTLSSPLLRPLLWDSLFLVSIFWSGCGSPRSAWGSLYSVYWHTPGPWAALTACINPSGWSLQSSMSMSDCLEINPLCPLTKYIQPHGSHRSRKLSLETLSIKCLRAQPSATLITLLVSSERSSRAGKGLAASQRRPPASWRSEYDALSHKSITNQCWSMWFSYCFY